MIEGIRRRWRFGAVAALIACLGLVAAALAFGDATGTQFRVSNQGHDGDASYYARLQDTSYNPQTNQYLVVFYNQGTDSTISGQFVDAAGNLVGGPFAISPTGADENPPSVTYNATNNEFLVSWYTGSDIQAQRVSASGALLGSVIPVSSVPYNDIETIDLAWSPEGNEYLVGWKGDTLSGGQQIYGRRIAGDGTPLDATDLQISHVPAPDSEADDAMALTYNTTDHEWLVAYRGWNYAQAPDGEYEIWGQRVALDGSDVGPADFRISHFGSDSDSSYFHGSRPRVAYDASRNQYLVTFMENLVPDEGGVEVFGQFVAANGDLIGSTFQISNITGGFTNVGVNGPDVVYDQFADLYLTVFQFSPTSTQAGSNAEIYGDYITGAGALTGTRDFPISEMGSSSNPSLAGLRPSVAFNSQTCDFMANWFGDTTQDSLVNNQWEVWGRLVTAPPCPPPVATTGSATNVTQTSATLNGSVNAKGHAATYHFEYGTTTAYGSSTAEQNDGSDFADHAESVGISGLAPGTTYHFRIVAKNAYGTTAGADQVFTTPAAAVAAAAKKPTVTTGGARGVTASAALLAGTVNPNGASTTYHFEYGRTTKYGKSTAGKSAGSGNSQVVAGVRIRGLAPGVTYHYRLVGTNSAGTTTGADRTFTTSPRLVVRGVRSGCITSAFRVSLGVTSAVSLRSVRVFVDGRRITSSTRKQLSVTVRSLKPGLHRVRVVVAPRRGSSAVRTLTYRACRLPTFTG
jgi:hypothetical protein